MFAFDKYLSPFLTPLGAALVAILLVLALMALGRRKLAFWLLLVTFASLYLTATPFVARRLSGVLESQFPPVPLAMSPTADVIVLLGGATDPALPPRQDPDLNAHADRIMHAADLYKAGKAKWIIASGGSWLYPSLGRAEALDMKDILMRFGVPASAVLVEAQSEDTGENAAFSLALMRQHHLTTALLVTSGIHMPRAMAVFRRAGITVTASATDLVAVASPDWPALSWLPSPEAEVETGEALHELAGALYYRLRGWT
jgi:uncharacterized SAM-binding protein YcdF (DUF218 family)